MKAVSIDQLRRRRQRLFGPRDAAEYLGISMNYLRDLSDRGVIPVYRFAGRRTFKLEDLEAVVDKLEPYNCDGESAIGPWRR